MNINKFFLSVFLTVASATAAYAAPHIGFMMPSGGTQGSTVDIIIGGQGFWNVNQACITGQGVTVESVQFVRGLPHPDGKQRRYINQILRLYHQKKPNTVKKPESTEGWRMHPFYDRVYDLTPCERDIMYRFLFVPQNSLQASPAISGRAIVKLKIAKDAPVGLREFRLIGRDGSLSNPLKFFVSNVPEVRENFFAYPGFPYPEQTFTVPSAINGQITPGETDRYKFNAKKNEVITFQLYGRFFNPFIGDGVPGHFQPVLEVCDAGKKVLAYADDNFFDPDPVLTFTAPEDGVYTLNVRDALYRGRLDFVYRINVFNGKQPAPNAAAPVIGKVPFKDMGSLLITSPVDHPVILGRVLTKAAGNNCPIKLEKGQEVVLEVFARRLGLPPDAVIKVFDDNGKLLAHNDDIERPKFGVILHNTADPMLVFKAPESGTYTINVSDVAQACGKEYKYFLRIDRKRKRFALYTAPSTLRLSANTANKISITAERFDQFNGEIKLKIVSPRGYRFLGADTIPANCSQADFTITGEYKKDRPIEELVIEGSAGKFKTRVIPGDEAMQAFAYTHINPAASFPVRVAGKGGLMEFQNIKNSKVVLPDGKPVTLTAKLVSGYIPPNVEIRLELLNKPDWVKVVSAPASKTRVIQYKEKIKVKAKGKKQNKGKAQYRTVTRSRVEAVPVKITLQADKNSAGKASNAVFQASWIVTSKPDKRGRVRKYPQRIILPAIQLQGGKN
ncbi:MAG: PPC domain-containing protein [Lentisphaeria bacterium]|nr:PPC domain-containing protein [Lentisphaeria bacterium]